MFRLPRTLQPIARIALRVLLAIGIVGNALSTVLDGVHELAHGNSVVAAHAWHHADEAQCAPDDCGTEGAGGLHELMHLDACCGHSFAAPIPALRLAVSPAGSVLPPDAPSRAFVPAPLRNALRPPILA